MWDVWRELEARHEVIVTFRDLPEWTGGACVTYIDGWAVVTLDPRLEPLERDAALAHELVHAERDLDHGCTRDRRMPRTWAAIEAREELHVDRTVARRLIHLGELEDLVDGMCSVGLGVGPDEVAEWFDVSPGVARDALLELARERKDCGTRRAV